MALPSIDDLIRRMRLQPHPEGGFYRESYRATRRIILSGRRHRNISTAIYFLLPRGSVSRLHRIRSDEIWHFYLGGPLEIVEITPRGVVKKTFLGSNSVKGHTFQHVVPAGHWFGARPCIKTPFSFVGCTVAPGFDFADFEMGKQKKLLRAFPKAKRTILKLS